SNSQLGTLRPSLEWWCAKTRRRKSPCPGLLSQSLECFAVALVRHPLCRLEIAAPFRWFGGRYDESPAISGDVERRLHIHVQQIENWLVDYERQAVPNVITSADPCGQPQGLSYSRDGARGPGAGSTIGGR